ncbi:hypothetical protein N8072_00730 [bacterium]|nr:hypothetical protein [bacterium]MDC1257187.1 hypothetical protein [bacterium]
MKLRRPFFKLLAALCLSFYCYNLASAETTTTDIYTSSPDDGSFSYDSNCPAGMSNAYVMDVGYENGGNSSSATAIAFGTCYDTFALTYTINQLLSEQGISVDKIHYGWKYINGCFNVTDPTTGQQIWCSENIEDRVDENGQPYGIYADQMDTLIVEVEITDANGNVIETRTYDYETWYHWARSNPHSSAEVYLDGAYWQIEEDFIQLYDHTNNTGTIYTPDSLGDANFRVMSKDGGYWEGYYGPIVRDGQIWFTYRTNPCNDTAMYDPSCPGYAEAYATYEYDNNCSANATYDPGCPGYADAYYNQQCSADPLYDSGCSGYADAYYEQQCSNDPLYDSGCSGYDTAYYNQQCNANALYDSGCDGYADAYYYNQCKLNPLYDSGCSGYDTAYYNYQCEANPLYDSGCPGYSTAYYNYQCEADPLYDSGCSGYDTAYYNQQCDANPLYDSGCTGYASAYLTAQCNADALYDASCTGHYEAQCNANPLYDFQCTGYDTAYLNQQCMYNPQYDTLCDGYIEPVTETAPVAEGTGTGDSIVDSVIATPQPVAQLMIMPQPPAPTPEPIVIEIIPIEVVEVELTEIEVIEAEIEAELEVVVEEVDTTDETTVSDTVEENNNEETTEKESSGDVEQPVDSNEGNDEGNESSDGDNGDETSEDTSGDTTEAEKPVTTKKPVLTAKQKQKAKERKMREIVKTRLSKLAVTMGEAVSLADQKALQSQITALINYVPGFNTYGQLAIPGRDFYGPGEFYDKDKKVPENNRGLLNGLASQILHEKMVDRQYEGME